MKKRNVLVAVLLLLLYSNKPVRGASEFTTTFNSTYEIGDTGSAQVEHHIDIKNNLAHIYTTVYTISIGSGNLSDLSVTIDDGNVPFKQETSENITTLTITVPHPVIGRDQVLPIVIRYNTNDLIDAYGGVLEVNIPRLNKANEASVYTRRVIVPEKLGRPSVESPHATTVSTDEQGNTILEYVGYPSDSITLLFGEKVTYKLNLVYKITNPTLAPADTEIAVPPDTEYQRILIDSIEPKPTEINVDADGNWLAIYPLKAQATEEIKVTLFATVYPKATFRTKAPETKPLLAEDTYWETKSTTIKSTASNLKSVQNIYNYVVENLTYDYSKITTGERAGAEKILNDPTSAICTEFTDLFVALARSAGIPAREINGYARTANIALRPSGFTEDILHSWPEYYDAETKTWIQVDPTWGRTTGGIDYFHKMDFGHIAFVRHGRESTYPHPAGSYKNNPQDKTIDVQLVDTIPEERKTHSEEKAEHGIRILNTGNVALENYKITLANGKTQTLDYIPPFGSQIVSADGKSDLTFIKRLQQLIISLIERIRS